MDKALRFRSLLVCLLLVAGLSALSGRLLMLQSWDRKTSAGVVPGSFRVNQVQPASRGLIVDRNNEPLSQNRPLATLIADGKHLKNSVITEKAVVYDFARQAADWNVIDSKTRRARLKKIKRDIIGPMEPGQILREHLVLATELLGRELNVPAGALREKIERGRMRIVLQKDIREDDARRIEELLASSHIQGFGFERSKERRYPMSSLAPHIIGFLNAQGLPQAGIEKSMDEYLRGRDGSRTLKRDAKGHVLLTESAAVVPPLLGKHVRLSIDIGIQSVVEEELSLVCERYEPKHATIVIIEPKTGDILAMANRPHYDLNLRENVSKAWSAFAWQGVYEPGSVMKVVGMSAALNEGKATRQTEVHCGWGRIRRPEGTTVRDHHKYGDLSFDMVLAKSSNTGTFLFSEMVGQKEFYQYLYGFGFGQKTGFPLPGEISGSVTEPRYPQNFASATFGYGLNVTPMQIAMAYSAIANGGKLLKPRLVKAVIANNGREVQTTPVHMVRRILNESAARNMRGALEQVALKGTARKTKVPGYRFCGKTGTAWKYIPEEKKYNTNRYALTFAGMLPVDDPKFVCVVTIDDPQKTEPDEKIGGGTVAAPVFARVASRVASRLNITPTEPIVEDAALTSN